MKEGNSNFQGRRGNSNNSNFQMASGSENENGAAPAPSKSIDVIVMCPCGAGRCHVAPLFLNPRILFLCCPRTRDQDDPVADAGGSGCGFMQWRWRDTVRNTTLPLLTSPLPPPSNPPPKDRAVPPLPCPCGAGPCSVGTAKNHQLFYFCPICKYRKWCDATSSSQCYICREEGHWHRDCPRLPPSAANNKNICFYCKQEDHYAAQCRFKRRRRK